MEDGAHLEAAATLAVVEAGAGWKPPPQRSPPVTLPLGRGGIACLLALSLVAGACLQPGPSRAPNPTASAGPVAPASSPAVVAATPSGVAGCPPGQPVSSVADLKAALASALPGTVILLSPGTYHGHLVATASGIPSAPIVLCGSRNAVIDGGSTKAGFAIHLDGASWWQLLGFSIQGAQKGVVADHATHDLIAGLYVHDLGDEGIHLRAFSSDNTIEAVTIRNTGLDRPTLGAGIYVGSATSNWCQISKCEPDTSDRNVIRGNDISGTTAENIDIREGTTGGLVVGNRLSGVGMVSSAATAWLNAMGNQWTIDGNVGEQSTKDGFQVHEVVSGWGHKNAFHGNRAKVDGPGYGFFIQSPALETILGCDNTATGAASGLSNSHCNP